MIRTKAPPAPQESPEAKAKREAEERRADNANLRNTQDVLQALTTTRRRRFGLLKPAVATGSQQGIVGGVAGLLQAAAGGQASGGAGGDLGDMSGLGISGSNFFYDVR